MTGLNAPSARYKKDPRKTASVVKAAASDINRWTHASFGLPPCQSACTHVVQGQWTALGLANVAARRYVAPEAWADPETLAEYLDGTLVGND